MTEDEILSALKPCPFCGAGETRAHVVIGWICIVHDCPRQGAFAQTTIIARSEALAISQWNARAGGE